LNIYSIYPNFHRIPRGKEKRQEQARKCNRSRPKVSARQLFSISCCHYAKRRSCVVSSLSHTVFHHPLPHSEFSWPLTFFPHEGYAFSVFFLFIWFFSGRGCCLRSRFSLDLSHSPNGKINLSPCTILVLVLVLPVSLGRGKPV